MVDYVALSGFVKRAGAIMRERLLGIFYEYKTSALVLIAANALPLFGVLFLGWDTFSIIVLYWVENVVVGLINILKMIVVNPDVDTVDWAKLGPEQVFKMRGEGLNSNSIAKRTKLVNQASKIFFIPFFVVHYGFFCLVHGFFVLALFGHEDFAGGLLDPLHGFSQILSDQRLWWCVVALAASHLCSFFVNFLGRGEYRRTAVLQLMAQPYSRIVVLHLAIIFGGMIAMMLGSNVGVLMLLVIGKTVLDVNLHLRERERNAPIKSQHSFIMPDVISGEEGPPATPTAAVQSHLPARSSSDD